MLQQDAGFVSDGSERKTEASMSRSKGFRPDCSDLVTSLGDPEAIWPRNKRGTRLSC